MHTPQNTQALTNPLFTSYHDQNIARPSCLLLIGEQAVVFVVMICIECPYLIGPLDSNVQGIDNNQLPGLPIGTFGVTARTQRGNIILVFHQYAHHSRGKSIHSSLQLEDNGVAVRDRQVASNGEQSLITNEGYAIRPSQLLERTCVPQPLSLHERQA